MPTLASELYRSLHYRINNLDGELRSLRAGIGLSQQGLAQAIEIASAYPGWLRDIAEREWERAGTDEKSRHFMADQYLEQIKNTAQFVNDWLRPSGPAVSPLLHRAVQRECLALKIGKRLPVLVSGTPQNFETYIDDFVAELFVSGDETPYAPPDHLPKVRFALMRVPTMESREIYWLPVVCGHEVAHLYIAEHPNTSLKITTRIDTREFEEVLIPRASDGSAKAPEMLSVVQSWVEEILCDFYAARRFGPSAGQYTGDGHLDFGECERWGT